VKVSARSGGIAATAAAVAVASAVVVSKDEAKSRPMHCPVTRANGAHPAGEPGGDIHGNGRLWTALNRNGRFTVAAESDPRYLDADGAIAVDGVLGPDGSVGIKAPWWRGPGIRGRVRIQARRLDAPAQPVDRTIPPSGYGLTGFQATGLSLPSTGCWRVTGSAGGARLTFVTLISAAR
jgi:hypothetical protein